VGAHIPCTRSIRKAWSVCAVELECASVNIYLFIYLILFNINDRKTRKPLILSEVHKKYTNIHKYTQYEKVFKNRNKQKDKKKQIPG